MMQICQKNLTYRKTRKTYAWRNPIDGKEIPLGKISRRDAIAQAIEANHYIEKKLHSDRPARAVERHQRVHNG